MEVQAARGLRRAMNFVRCNRNWTSRPTPTRNVGHQPRGIAHDLQHRGAVVVGETGLVESQALMAQRVVHVDHDLAPGPAVVGVEAQRAGEVLRDLRARIAVVRELQQRQREGLIRPPRPQREPPRAAGMGEFLRVLEQRRREEGPDRALRADQLHIRGGIVFRLRLVAEGLRRRRQLQARAVRRRHQSARAVAAPRLQRGIGKEHPRHHPEGQARVRDRRLVREPFRRDRHHVVVRRGRRVDQRQLVVAVALRVVPRLPFVEAQVEIFLPEPGEQLAHEQHDQARVRERDAGFAPRKREAQHEAADQIQQQQPADRVAAREQRDRDRPRVTVNHEGPEILFLHRPDPEVHLVQRGGEDEHATESEQHEREG